MGTVPVTGSVSYQGKPLTSGTITFSPNNKDSGHAAWGNLGAGGSYSLTSIKTNDGALPGEYKVAVIAYIPGTATKSSPGKPAIPPKYSRHAESGLTATVNNTTTSLDFDLQ